MSILSALKYVLTRIIKAFLSERGKLRLKVIKFYGDVLRHGVYSSLNKEKLALIDFAFTFRKADSFADLGAIWGVNGGYTFYALDKYNPTKAILVDTRPVDIIKERSKKYQQLRLIQGHFGDRRIAQEVGQVDIIFLFDILVHQVTPDWDKILEIYGHQTQCLVIFNPQWIGTDSTIRLTNLSEKEYFQNVPHSNTEEGPYYDLFQKLDQIAPEYDRKWRDIHHLWQWGITDRELKEKIERLKFRLQYFKNCGQFGNLKNFENHAFVFSK
jgi:hypothetical protein